MKASYNYNTVRTKKLTMHAEVHSLYIIAKAAAINSSQNLLMLNNNFIIVHNQIIIMTLNSHNFTDYTQ